MDGTEVLSFAGSAPLIALIIGFLMKPLLGDRLNEKTIPIACLVLAAAWGGVLSFSDLLNVNLATFIVTTVIVATSASGMRSWAKGGSAPAK